MNNDIVVTYEQPKRPFNGQIIIIFAGILLFVITVGLEIYNLSTKSLIPFNRAAYSSLDDYISQKLTTLQDVRDWLYSPLMDTSALHEYALYYIEMLEKDGYTLGKIRGMDKEEVIKKIQSIFPETYVFHTSSVPYYVTNIPD